jgi:primosomal protein N' (replication factor Y)
MDYHFSQHKSGQTGGLIAGVAFPVAIPGVYDYKIPPELTEKVLPGVPVLVEVRKRQTWGVAVVLKDSSDYHELKEILDVKSGQWVDSNQSLIKLYEWMAAYYQCDLGRVFRPLVSKGLISTKSKKVPAYRISTGLPPDIKSQYKEVYDIIKEQGTATRSVLVNAMKIKPSMIDYLCKKGIIEKQLLTIIREADEMRIETAQDDVTLSDEQKDAVEKISSGIADPQKPYLLYGITGSGKTHVYIDLVKFTLACGKGVIILVPEISLTPQTIQRFRSALGDVMTVIHSNMSDGERRDSLQELVTGKKRVVIGVRSAILVPMENVGLIIVDEEHDSSYKQSDLDPRYNSRDIAVMRGHFQKAAVVLGSATPSLESYQNALSGKYHLVKLSRRYGAAALPSVKIIDMNQEHRENNWTLLSKYLETKIGECLNRKRQIILLLNRRGFSTVLLCKDCGHTYMCPCCSVNLRYHRADSTLKCHLCGHVQPAPDLCPACKGEQIKYKGTGIQKAEEFVREKFPDANILRMDQDTTRRKGAHVSILTEFAEKKADILLGTQMVSKGLNFPGVALVGVIQADTGLHFPDFRASERTFQLLTQVAGRAGRADSLGEVVIQTYNPDEMAISAASEHDYEKFFTSEIVHRKELGYPPFGKIARLIVEGKKEEDVIQTITKIARVVRKNADSDLHILGPSPAVLSRIENESRYSMLLKSSSYSKLGSALVEVRKSMHGIPGSIRMIIDVDPVNML